MKKQVFPNDVWIEILHYLPIQSVYPSFLSVNKQMNSILTNKHFLHDLAQSHLIPKMFIAKYFKELARPVELLQIAQLWREQSPIYINELIDKGESISGYHHLVWRMDIIVNTIKMAPELTPACIPISGSKALFVNLSIPKHVFDKMEEESQIMSLRGEILTNFVEVEGDVINVKTIDERNYIDLDVERVDFVVNIEDRVRLLPKAGLNPLETPFDLFYCRYKGKLIQWNGYIDEILSPEAFTIDDPQITLHHKDLNNIFCEGDMVEFKGRVGTLMSIHCDQIFIKTPVTLWRYIQQDVIALTASTSLCYFFKRLYQGEYRLRGLSQFMLAFVGIMALQYNLLYHHEPTTKIVLNFAAGYGIYRYWGRWATGGTHILFMILTGTISITVLFNLISKLTKKLKTQPKINK